VSGTGPPGPAFGLFAKPPRPGEVKTRLVPPLTAHDAARLYAAMLADTAVTLDEAAVVWGVFSTDVEAQRATWPAGAPAPSFWLPQTGADLGERMSSAAQELLRQGYPGAMLVGSDHPVVDAETYRRAAALLGSSARSGVAVEKGAVAVFGLGTGETLDVVLGPTHDGGYYLIGLTRPNPTLFGGIEWSTPKVLEETLERLIVMRLQAAILESGWDVDRPEDLERLRSWLEATSNRSPAPCRFTREVMASLPRS
jgi:glycosyltransferase A (GT-A) superfamily protein (DUF2064 family)